MYRTSIDYLSTAEASPLNASVLARPMSQIAGNVDSLKQQVEAITGQEGVLASIACASSVSVGSPVGWNSVTKQFELALTSSKPALGVCVSKPSTISANVRMVGFDLVDLTVSTGSALPPAGLYYLSQTVAGALSLTRPAAGVQQPVLYADGQGGIFLFQCEYLPLAGPQGIQGAAGTTGATGAAGAQGAAGPAALPGFVSGQWYTGPLNYSPVGVNTNFASGTLIAVPFAAPGGATITELAVKILAAGNPGDEGRLGIYADSSQYPGALLSAANGVFNGASAGAKVVSVNNTVLAAGQLVWLVMLMNSNAIGLLGRVKDTAWAFKGYDDGLQDAAIGYSVPQTYGAMPTTFPSNGTELTDVIPTIFAKAA